MFVSGDTEGNVLSANATITLVSSDNLSSVKSTKYRLGDEGSYHTYYQPISLHNLSDGEFTLNYYSIDNVDNREDELSTATAQGYYRKWTGDRHKSLH